MIMCTFVPIIIKPVLLKTYAAIIFLKECAYVYIQLWTEYRPRVVEGLEQEGWFHMKDLQNS